MTPEFFITLGQYVYGYSKDNGKSYYYIGKGNGDRCLSHISSKKYSINECYIIARNLEKFEDADWQSFLLESFLIVKNNLVELGDNSVHGHKHMCFKNTGYLNTLWSEFNGNKKDIAKNEMEFLLNEFVKVKGRKFLENNRPYYDHPIFTPYELCDEIIDHIGHKKLKKAESILIMYTLEFIPRLLEIGVPRESIWIYTKEEDELVKNTAKDLFDIYNYITDEDLEGMKFDVVLGNPPFSKKNRNEDNKGNKGRGTDLYDQFYEMSLNLSNKVAMIMPTSHKHQQKKHNNLIKNTANIIKFIDPSLFPTVQQEMWYIVSIKNSNKVPQEIDWKYSGEIRNNINWSKGKFNVTTDKHLLERDTQLNDSDVKIYHKINEMNGLVIKYADSGLVPVSKRFPNTGYAVLMPQQIQDTGWSKTEIIECDGKQAAMNGMNIAFVKTEEEAKKLNDYMKTDDFINEALKYRGGMGNMVLWALQSIQIKKY